MSGTWASGWALNDVVSVSEFAKGTGGVADSTLSASAASIDFTGLPTTYAHLTIFAYLRGDTAATNVALGIRFNNDGGANYDSQVIFGNATGSTSGEAFAQTSIGQITVPANTAPANVFGAIRVDVPNYSNSTNNKALTAQVADKRGTATTNLVMYNLAGFWRNSSAINRVTLFPGLGNFVTGSRVGVYVWGA